MTDQYIYDLAYIFKSAMIVAKEHGCFDNDGSFRCFPRRCCGDTCYLLASFLRENGIETLYVWGDRGYQSHAWLVVNDSRVKTPTQKHKLFDEGYAELISSYGGSMRSTEESITYTARDLTDALIVDITADQFEEPFVYVGKRNTFYRRFAFRGAYVCNGVHDNRLQSLYESISLFFENN